jgi:hypothetical protein
MSRGAIEEDVTPRDTIERMTRVRRILKLLGAALAFAVYVWFAAVRYAPGVKARKARRRGR